MKKLTYKGKPAKVILLGECIDCIFEEYCNVGNFDVVKKWEKKNKIENCMGVIYAYA